LSRVGKSNIGIQEIGQLTAHFIGKKIRPQGQQLTKLDPYALQALKKFPSFDCRAMGILATKQVAKINAYAKRHEPHDNNGTAKATMMIRVVPRAKLNDFNEF
jgi:hypothetical protein